MSDLHEEQTEQAEQNVTPVETSLSLDTALEDWTPDTAVEATPRAKKSKTEDQPIMEPSQGPCTFVGDPFNFPTSEEYGDEEEKTEEELDTLPPETDEDYKIDEIQISKIAEAIAEETQAHEEEVKQLAEQQAVEDTQEAEARLAEEIAQDLALQEEVAREEEEANKTEDLSPALLDQQEMQSCLEALMFMSDKPISAEKLQELLGPSLSLSLFQEALTAIQDRYRQPEHGFELVEVAGGYQFRTKPGRAELAKKLAKIQVQRLSTGAMETLAIVAYRQPVMKEDVDKIRGVDSSHFIRGLLDRKLIRIAGRSELPGRPMVYETGPEFLELFGLGSLQDMPSLRELEQMVPASQTQNPDEEDPRVKEMRRMVNEMKMDSASGVLNYDPREDDKILREIREQVNSIPITTPTLEEQKRLEKEAALQASQPKVELNAEGQAQLPLNQPAIETAPTEAAPV